MTNSVGAKKSAKYVDIANKIMQTTSSIVSAIGLDCIRTPIKIYKVYGFCAIADCFGRKPKAPSQHLHQHASAGVT
jgi:hypothetical protein